MKKITLTSIAAVALGTILSVFLVALPALAATTASITPTSVRVVAGHQFNVVVAVNPNGTSDYAEQLQISYPANLLQVTAFNIGNSWMSLTQPGYDSIDNINGVMTKTAGYTGGITSLTPFGTITFTARKSGSGMITIGSASQAFEKSSQTAITGTGAVFVVTVATIAPVATPKASAPAPADLTPATTTNGQVLATTTAQEDTAAVAASQVAAANTAASGLSGSTWTWILVVLVILIVIAVYLVSKRKKNF